MRRKKSKKVSTPTNPLEELIVFTHKFDRALLGKRWGQNSYWVKQALEHPWNHLTYDHIQDLAMLTQKDIVEIFLMCKRTAKFSRNDNDLKVILYAEKLGVGKN